MALPRNRHRGYVYILTNECIPNMIKVGRTKRDTVTRAREISTTGVPMPFEVAFEILSENYRRLEEEAHRSLAPYRVRTNREFFRCTLTDGASLLKDLNSAIASLHPYAESIYHRLKYKYPDSLKRTIIDVRIVQTSERVWLEIIDEQKYGELVNQTAYRHDLRFIVDTVDGRDEYTMFDPDLPVFENARKFVEKLDDYNLLATFDLFNKKTLQKINVQSNNHPNLFSVEQ
jgi:hypothetical protein